MRDVAYAKQKRSTRPVCSHAAAAFGAPAEGSGLSRRITRSVTLQPTQPNPKAHKTSKQAPESSTRVRALQCPTPAFRPLCSGTPSPLLLYCVLGVDRASKARKGERKKRQQPHPRKKTHNKGVNREKQERKKVADHVPQTRT